MYPKFVPLLFLLSKTVEALKSYFSNNAFNTAAKLKMLCDLVGAMLI